MDTARWSQVREILEAALEREPADRERFVGAACAGDSDLGRHVLSLLACDDDARALEPPAPGFSPVGRPAPDASMIGARVGRYRILRLIGFGGMGAVYEAEQEQPRRTVALKVMRPSLATAHALRRFEFEAQVLARLRHPSIAAVFEAGTHNPDPSDPSRAVPYFAMEHVQGAAPITDFARARSLSIRQRLELFAAVCDAVHHGHQQGVIHRDLKPGNVLVDSDGRPRIIDFGIARTLDQEPAASATGGQVLGTLQYMSPEQCAPGGEGVDTRSDVYSLGVMLYELLAGRAPYALTNASIPEAVRRVREVDPPPLGEVDRALKGDVETIVRAAMEKSRERRYPAAASLAADIRHYLRSEPIAARPPTAMYQLRVFARRNKPLVAAAVAAFAVLVLGIVATSIAARSAREEARRARRIADFYKDTITAGNPYLAGTVSMENDWWEDPPVPRAASPTAADGRSFTVPDLVEVAGSRLPAVFADEPEIEAELDDTLGRTLAHMGRGGLDLLQRALDIRERTLGRDDERTIRTRLALAVRVEGIGDFGRAENEFRAAFESCVRAFGPDDPRTLAAERRLAVTLTWSDPAQSLALARRALDHSRRVFGDDDPATLAARSSLSNALRATADLAGAEEEARAALAGWCRIAGEDSVEVAGARLALSGVLVSERASAEAEALLRRALPVLREHFGGDIVYTFYCEMHLVQLLRRMSRSGDAAREMRRVLESARAAFGDESHHVLKLEATLARTLIEAGSDLEEAERIAGHAADGLAASIGAADLNTVLAADTLDCAIRARGRAAEALAGASKLLESVRAMGIEEPQVIAALHQTIGECRLDLGESDAAASSLSEAWRIAEEGAAFASDPYHPRRLALIAALARVEEVRGSQDAAAAWRARLPEPDETR